MADSTVVAKDVILTEIHLVIFTKNHVFQEYDITRDTYIGRMTETSVMDIMLDSAITSRKHGVFKLFNGCFAYEDLGSKNGTYINGKLRGNMAEDGKKQVLLRNGDVIRIDHSDIDHPHPEAVVMMVMSKPKENMVQKTIKLKAGTSLTIGRNVGNIKLENKMVSAEHACFEYNNGIITVRDLKSTNGVFVNGIRLEPGESRRLYNMSFVRIVDYSFLLWDDTLFYYCEETAHKALVIKIEEKSVIDHMKKKTLLKDINISINEGEMVMLLGGSGAGKTTFFNAIMGYEKAKGSVYHNDVDLYKNYKQAKHEIGYVAQQDLLRQSDTVYMTLFNAAEMKMGRGYSDSDRKLRVEEVLIQLGLIKERNSVVKSLSGGQKKRLGVGVELVGDPSLLFLDEPDSGLAGVNATELMSWLRTIADNGKTVLVITHSPDRVKHLFDRLIVLAKSEVDNVGRLAFYGTFDEAYRFFDVDNCDDIVRRINLEAEGGEGKADYYIERYAKLQEK